MTATLTSVPMRATAARNGLRRVMTRSPDPTALSAARTKAMRAPIAGRLPAPGAQRHRLWVRREKHVLGVDLRAAPVLRELVLLLERDRVEGACDLAVAAEDAAEHVDLVDAGVAL